MTEIAGRANGPEHSGSVTEFLDADCADILARWGRHQAFWDARLAAGLDPYNRTSIVRVGPECVALTRGQERIMGVNFACQDYLSLASHPAVCAAAIEAVGRWGVQGGGPVAFQGATPPLVALEERLAEVLACSEVTVFPSGWAAGYGAIRALVRETDHIIIDAATQGCLRDGSANATRHIHSVPNCSHAAVRHRLAEIRKDDAGCGILVITEALFSTDSTIPDLRTLQDLCRDYGATLLVGVAHDFGAIGDGGLGIVGKQGLIGKIDLIVGSFSKTFASNGGFVASGVAGIKQALRVFAEPLARSSALSPVQAAIVDAALSIVRSREGAERRARLMHNVVELREKLAARAFRVLGEPSAIVPVWLGDIAEAREMTRAALARGGLVNLVEHPAVGRQNARWRLQVMADHNHELIERFVASAVAARETLGPLLPQGSATG